MENANILVVGAGAVGGVTAAVLKRSGFDVMVVCKYPDLAKTISTKGLRVSGVHGVFEQIMPAVAQVSELKGTYQLVMIATKAPEMVNVARNIHPYLAPDGLVVSMQNGICEDTLAEILGRERVVGCVVGWGATMHERGWVEMTSTGEFVIGSLPGVKPNHLEPLREVLNHVVPTRISTNIYGHLFSKLIINSCITSMGAISGLKLGPMLARKKVRNLFIEIMRESMDVANAMHISVEVYAGKLNYEAFLKGAGWFARLRRHVFIRIMGIKYRKLKSSSLQSLERKQNTEIDYLNGYIVQQARHYAIAVPINEKITKMVKAIECGDLDIRADNLNELDNKDD